MDQEAAKIGRNIKELLKRRHMKQKELAAILGVSESTVGKWVLGHNNPRMGCIQKMADFFQVKKSALLGESALYATDSRTIPVLRAVRGGPSLLLPENLLDEISLPDSWDLDFALMVPDDALSESGIRKGNVVLCRQCTWPDPERPTVCGLDNDPPMLRFIRGDRSTPILTVRREGPQDEDRLDPEPARLRIFGQAIVTLASVGGGDLSDLILPD